MIILSVWKNYSHHKRAGDLSQGQKALLQLPPPCALLVLLHLLSNWLPTHGQHTMCLIIRIINGKTRSSQVQSILFLWCGPVFSIKPIEWSPHQYLRELTVMATYFLITLWICWKFFSEIESTFYELLLVLLLPTLIRVKIFNICLLYATFRQHKAPVNSSS